MDYLQTLFANRSQSELQDALEEAGDDVNEAIDRLLAPSASPLQLKSEPELSPASSADSFQQLKISDADEDEDGVEVSRAAPQRMREGNLRELSEDDIISKILELFSDCTIDHIKKLYKEHHILQGVNLGDFIVEQLIENGYPRIQRGGQKRKRSPEDTALKPDYFSPERPPVSDEYKTLVRKILQQEFPLVPAQHINKILLQHRYFLAPAYSDLEQDERDFSSNGRPKSYKRLLSARKIVDNDRSKMGKCWSAITEELAFARGNARKKEMNKQLEKDAQLATEINEKEHEETGMLWECGCCFGEYAFDNMTHCDEIHFFCMDCARRNAENEVGNGRHKLCCMHESGCKAEFPRREVLRFLDEKTLAALAKAQQEEAIRLANIDGLEQCPFCDYAAICEPVEVNKEFTCLNPDCGEVSCRHCQKKSHIPMTCEENAKEDKISHRHHLEEAMTEALIRKCKKCASPFIKEYGCNKVSCHRCGTLQCYICSEIVKGYDHFNDPNRGGKDGNCALFDNTEERHEEEIQAAAKEAMQRLREENPELEEEDLQIKLSEEVKQREAARRAAGRVPGYVQGPPRVVHQVAPPIAPPLAAGYIPGAGIFNPLNPQLIRPIVYVPQVLVAPPIPVPAVNQRSAVRRADPRANGRHQHVQQHQPPAYRAAMHAPNNQPPQAIPLHQMQVMPPVPRPFPAAQNNAMQDMMNMHILEARLRPFPPQNVAQRPCLSGQQPNAPADPWIAGDLGRPG